MAEGKAAQMDDTTTQWHVKIAKARDEEDGEDEGDEPEEEDEGEEETRSRTP